MTPFCDSHSQLPFVTRCFATTLSCGPTTDGQTVSTPKHHLPSIPNLTLIKHFGTFSTTWPHPLVTSTTMSTTPCGLVSPDTLSGSPPVPEASTPHARPPVTIPTFITPSAPPSIPPVWEHVIAALMKLPLPLQRDTT